MTQLNQRRKRERFKEVSFSCATYLPRKSRTARLARSLAAVTTLGLTAGSLFAADLFVPNVVKRELYNGSTRQDIEAGTAGTPSSVDFLDIFQTLDFADNYAQKLSGVFIPPTTGNYIFFVSSDDDSDLFLSTDANPANKRLIATETAWSSSRQWTTSAGTSNLGQKRSDQFSPDSGSTHPFASGIPLVAGQRYYIEGVHHEGGGGDNFGATFITVGEGDPIDGDDSMLSAVNNNIGVVIKLPTQLTLTISPTNVSSFPGGYVQLQSQLQTDTDDAVLYQWRKNGVNIAGATNANYSFIAGANDADAKFDLDVSFPHVTNTIRSSQATLALRSDSIIKTGALKNQLWTGGTRVGVENGATGEPAQVSVLPAFESPVNERDNFTRRISGWFTPATTGDYVFFVTSDDDSDLFLSTDENPANRRLIAQETIWSDPRKWVSSGGGSDLAQKRSDQFTPDQGVTFPYSSGIHLVAGQKYFIEGVEHEGSGGDNLGATFKLVSEPDPADDDPSRLTNGVISYATSPVTVFAITNQVQNVTTNEDRTVIFNVGVTTDSEFSPLYQWRRNGTNIPNANASSYILTAQQADNNATFDVVITLPQDSTKTLTSAAGKLTVISSTLVNGYLKREFWANETVASVEGGTTAALPVTDYIYGWDLGSISDNYAQRVSGFFIPPATGKYVFFVAADDDSDLFLSTDETPANKRLIAQQPNGTWSNQRQWNALGGTGAVENKRSDTFSPDAGATIPFAEGIQLTGGQRYYIEGVHHDGTGGDSFAVTFKTIEEADPADGDAAKMAGNAVAALLPKPERFTVAQQPQSASVPVGAPFTLTVGVDTDAFISPGYQWRKNGTVISNATRAVFTKITTPDDSGAAYDVVLTLPGFTNTTTSAAATVTLSSSNLVVGSLRREVFTNSGDRINLEAGSVNRTATVDAGGFTNQITSFDAPANFTDNYVQRVSGFFIPDTTGDYVFFLTSDDQSDLYLSTDANPANKRLIATETGWSDPRKWISSGGGSDLTKKRSDQFSPDGGVTVPFANGIHLVAGQKYYIEADHGEGGGGDNLGVTFKLTTEPDPEDDSLSRLTGNLIAHVEGGNVTPPDQPVLTVTRNGASLSISWTGGGSLQYTDNLGTGAVWTDLTSTSPASVTPDATHRFFRVKK